MRFPEEFLKLTMPALRTEVALTQAWFFSIVFRARITIYLAFSTFLAFYFYRNGKVAVYMLRIESK